MKHVIDNNFERLAAESGTTTHPRIRKTENAEKKGNALNTFATDELSVAHSTFF